MVELVEVIGSWKKYVTSVFQAHVVNANQKKIVLLRSTILASIYTRLLPVLFFYGLLANILI
jgi:hypothetical protein